MIWWVRSRDVSFGCGSGSVDGCGGGLVVWRGMRGSH